MVEFANFVAIVVQVICGVVIVEMNVHSATCSRSSGKNRKVAERRGMTWCFYFSDYNERKKLSSDSFVALSKQAFWDVFMSTTSFLIFIPEINLPIMVQVA